MRGLGAIDDIITTLDSNKGFAVVGPMTDWAQSAAGALRTMGLEKPAIDAWLSKRGTIIQAEAKLALDGAAAAANQGAISNFERDMIAAAASPNNKLTDPQMRAALVGIQKMHAYTILGHQREYEATAPGLGPLSKTYEVKITPEQRGKYESILAGPRFESVDDVVKHANTKRETPATAGTKPEAAPGADAITRAQDAIRRGAPRDAVIKRLRDAGLPTDGL